MTEGFKLRRRRTPVPKRGGGAEKGLKKGARLDRMLGGFKREGGGARDKPGGKHLE